MEIQINGETRTFDGDAYRVVDLLDAMEVDQTEGMAVAVNRSVVPRSQWEEREVTDGDEVEIIRATQGG